MLYKGIYLQGTNLETLALIGQPIQQVRLVP